MLAACASPPSPTERHHHAETFATAAGWRPLALDADPFRLTAFVPRQIGQAPDLTIYLEGDGFAWVSPTRPSPDPTPLDPLALRLALAHPDGNAAYLARPCQFEQATQPTCASAYWTHARFAPEVVDASNRAIDQLKGRFGAQRLALVGYSGGGAVAALVAARRDDVHLLVTVAGNLDTTAWTRLHRLSPLTGSLNPADFLPSLGGLRQWHYTGGRDRIIPPTLTRDLADRFPPATRPTVHTEPSFDHHCCWVEHWPRLWREVTYRPNGDSRDPSQADAPPAASSPSAHPPPAAHRPGR